MMGQTILFTGGTSGLGEVAFRKMALAGHQMILLARNVERAQDQFKDLQEKTDFEIIQADLSSFDSLRKAIQIIKEKYKQLDQLVLNAGLWNFSFKESKDGIEEILHVNLLANILLIDELKDSMNKQSRIIITSSALHQGKINYEDLQFRSKYSGFKAYRQSKLGTVLISNYLAEKFKNDHIKVVCQHPGVVATRLGRDAGKFSNLFFKLFGKSPEKGARTLMHLMQLEYDQIQSGAYYANSKVKKTHAYSRDRKNGEKLWEFCMNNYLNK